MADNSLFSRIGGHTEINRLANRFYDVMERDSFARPVLNLHPDDLTRSRKRLENFLCEWFGGPKLFGEQYVNPDWLKLRHQHLNIGTDERDQWLYCMKTAMQELNYDQQLQHDLNSRFFKLAGFLRVRA
ncbi:MAG: group II truncated hemoglobin [Pseudomonadota bacterium]